MPGATALLSFLYARHWAEVPGLKPMPLDIVQDKLCRRQCSMRSWTCGSITQHIWQHCEVRIPKVIWLTPAARSLSVVRTYGQTQSKFAFCMFRESPLLTVAIPGSPRRWQIWQVDRCRIGGKRCLFGSVTLFVLLASSSSLLPPLRIRGFTRLLFSNALGKIFFFQHCMGLR